MGNPYRDINVIEEDIIRCANKARKLNKEIKELQEQCKHEFKLIHVYFDPCQSLREYGCSKCNLTTTNLREFKNIVER